MRGPSAGSAHPHAPNYVGGNQYLYDADGNLTSAESRTYEYDIENHLTRVLEGGTPRRTLTYDGDGVLRSLTNESNQKTLYVTPDYQVNLATGDISVYYQLGGRGVAWRNNSSLRYVLADHLSSTHAELGENQAEMGQRRYFPFGSDRAVSGASDIGDEERFTSQRRIDNGNGNARRELYHYGARWQLPGVGIFAQPDTIVPDYKNPQALNRYSYVLNNPLKYMDPTGNYVVFIGGMGTSVDREPISWAKMIVQLGLQEGEYGFFDWTVEGQYSEGFNKRSVQDTANDLASFLKDKKDITLIGHSKGGDLILEYLAQVAEGGLAGNSEVKKAFILDSPTDGISAAEAGLRTQKFVGRGNGLPGLAGTTVANRFENLPQKVAESTNGSMTVDVAMIANLRDLISGPPIPGIPYFSFKAGNDRVGDWPVVGGAAGLWGTVRGPIHGLVQRDPWVAGFISWYRQ